MSAELTFKIQDASDKEATIKADVLAQVLSGMLQVAKEFDDSVTGEAGVVEWRVTRLEIGSAAWALSPQINFSQSRLKTKTPESVQDAIVAGFVGALESIQRGGGVRPRGLGDEALSKIRASVRSLKNAGYRFWIGIGYDWEHLSIDENTERQIDEWLEAPRETIGSIEGTLEMLQTHDKGNMMCGVWDKTGKKVVGHFKPELLPEITKGVERRVRVRGTIRRRRDGIAESIRIQSVHVIPLQSELPSIDSMIGILDLGMPGEQYVRRLRDAE